MIRIVVAQRGWVFIGDLAREENEIVIRRARSVRTWGTDKGLGQLFMGPRPGTKLDEAGTVRLHPLQVICTIDVDEEAWAKVLT